jgi:hypothetical protein
LLRTHRLDRTQAFSSVLTVLGGTHGTQGYSRYSGVLGVHASIHGAAV